MRTWTRCLATSSGSSMQQHKRSVFASLAWFKVLAATALPPGETPLAGRARRCARTAGGACAGAGARRAERLAGCAARSPASPISIAAPLRPRSAPAPMRARVPRSWRRPWSRKSGPSIFSTCTRWPPTPRRRQASRKVSPPPALSPSPIFISAIGMSASPATISPATWRAGRRPCATRSSASAASWSATASWRCRSSGPAMISPPASPPMTRVHDASWKDAEPYPDFLPRLVRDLGAGGAVRLGLARGRRHADRGADLAHRRRPRDDLQAGL